MFGDALAQVGWAYADDVYWAARATLCRRPEEIALFDACFAAWFRSSPTAALGGGIVDDPATAIVALDAPLGPEPDGEDGDPEIADGPILPCASVAPRRYATAISPRTRRRNTTKLAAPWPIFGW